jgi:hypothetical protein
MILQRRTSVPGQVFHGLFLARLDPGATEDVKTGMTPLHEHINQVFRDFSF